MSIQKLKNFTDSINEAVKIEEGKYYKVSTLEKLGQKNDENDASGKPKGWVNYAPDQPKGIDVNDGAFYEKVENAGRDWIKGKFIVGNCLTDRGEHVTKVGHNPQFVHAHRSVILDPGKELDIFLRDKIEDNPVFGKKFLFHEGDDYLMDIDGTNKKIEHSREYVATGCHFKLTVELDESVIYLKTVDNKDFVFARLSDLSKSFGGHDENQMKVIADYFSIRLDHADIKASSHDNKYELKTWYIKAENVVSEENMRQFSAGPFLSKNQAESVLSELKKSLGSVALFDKETLKVEERFKAHSLTLEMLVEMMEKAGNKIDIKDLQSKLSPEGARVISKKFNLNKKD